MFSICVFSFHNIICNEHKPKGLYLLKQRDLSTDTSSAVSQNKSIAPHDTSPAKSILFKHTMQDILNEIKRKGRSKSPIFFHMEMKNEGAD